MKTAVLRQTFLFGFRRWRNGISESLTCAWIFLPLLCFCGIKNAVGISTGRLTRVWIRFQTFLAMQRASTFEPNHIIKLRNLPQANFSIFFFSSGYKEDGLGGFLGIFNYVGLFVSFELRTWLLDFRGFYSGRELSIGTAYPNLTGR